MAMDLWSVPADFICLSGCLAALFWRGRVREVSGTDFLIDQPYCGEGRGFGS